MFEGSYYLLVLHSILCKLVFVLLIVGRRSRRKECRVFRSRSNFVLTSRIVNFAYSSSSSSSLVKLNLPCSLQSCACWFDIRLGSIRLEIWRDIIDDRTTEYFLPRSASYSFDCIVRRLVYRVDKFGFLACDRWCSHDRSNRTVIN